MNQTGGLKFLVLGAYTVAWGTMQRMSEAAGVVFDSSYSNGRWTCKTPPTKTTLPECATSRCFPK